MTHYESMKVSELKSLISNKEDFANNMGISLSSARKNKLIEYLKTKDGDIVQEKPIKLRRANSETDLSSVIINKPFNPTPPKVDKQFIPDPAKLEKIREAISEPVDEQKPIDEEVIQGLDEEDSTKITNIINNDQPSYIYDEVSETKCKKYGELYPTIKPILSSSDFKSSKEKLKYIENYIDSTRMNANFTNYIFALTTMAERNQTVNQYVKLRGYTKQLATRRAELETYVEELKIKYMDEVGQYLSMPVEVRIGLIFAETAYQVHLENTQIELHNKIVMEKSQNNIKK